MQAGRPAPGVKQKLSFYVQKVWLKAKMQGVTIAWNKIPACVPIYPFIFLFQCPHRELECAGMGWEAQHGKLANILQGTQDVRALLKFIIQD